MHTIHLARATAMRDVCVPLWYIYVHIKYFFVSSTKTFLCDKLFSNHIIFLYNYNIYICYCKYRIYSNLNLKRIVFLVWLWYMLRIFSFTVCHQYHMCHKCIRCYDTHIVYLDLKSMPFKATYLNNPSTLHFLRTNVKDKFLWL